MMITLNVTQWYHKSQLKLMWYMRNLTKTSAFKDQAKTSKSVCQMEAESHISSDLSTWWRTWNWKQLLLKKSPNCAGASEWPVLVKVFLNMLEHLLCGTNKYAKRQKHARFSNNKWINVQFHRFAAFLWLHHATWEKKLEQTISSVMPSFCWNYES